MVVRLKNIFIVATIAFSTTSVIGQTDDFVGESGTPALQDDYIERQQNLKYNNNSDYIPIENVPCVDFSQNKFIIPGSDELVMNLYNKIDQIIGMGQGKISIMHIGGSHVQAGIFSHRLRENFRWFIDDEASCMGIIFPYKTMGTNAPINYKMSTTGTWTKARCIESRPSLPLGVSGAAIRTSSSAASISFDLKSQENYMWLYNKLIVLGDGDYMHNPPRLVVRQDTILPLSYEHGGWIFHFPEEDEASEGKVIFPGANITPVTIRGLIPENTYSGVMYHEAGINGASVPAWLRCSRFEEELRHIAPDMVVFGIGINDANVSPSKFDKEKFKNNYRSLIAKIRRVKPEAVFVFITNNDCRLNMKGYGNRYNPNSLKVEQAFMELAKEYNGIVWNLFRVMGGPGSSKEWVNYKLMQSDRIHFTRAGYELIGDLLYNAFVTDYKNIK